MSVPGCFGFGVADRRPPEWRFTASCARLAILGTACLRPPNSRMPLTAVVPARTAAAAGTTYVATVVTVFAPLYQFEQ
jgi:hypothetical protein